MTDLHVHLHVCALDGVYVDEGATPRFVHTAPPTRTELSRIAARVCTRVTAWLLKRRYIKPDAELYDSNDPPQRSFEEVLAAFGTRRGTLERLRDDTGEPAGEGEDLVLPSAKSDAVTHHGFNLHADVTLAANDDLGRERLFRYGLRPPFALSRLRRLPDGRMAYRVKKSGRGRTKCRVMTPVECIGRLCALIPPPRYPLTRFAGVLAPRAKLRPRIVPRLPEAAAAPPTRCAAHAPSEQRERATAPRRDDERVIPCERAVSTYALALGVRGADVPAPNIVSAKHLARLAGGLL